MPAADTPVRPGWVYFAYAPLVHRCKIGWTNRTPEQRLSNSTDSPDVVNLWGMLYGFEPLEKELHHHFRHLRIKGEWFAVDDELRRFVQDHTYESDAPMQSPHWSAGAWATWDRMMADDEVKKAIQEPLGLCQRSPVKIIKEYVDPLSYFYAIVKPAVCECAGWESGWQDDHFMKSSAAYDVLYEMCVDLLPV